METAICIRLAGLNWGLLFKCWLMKTGVDGIAVKALKKAVLFSLHSPAGGGGGLE